jgi:hypothetical protein
VSIRPNPDHQFLADDPQRHVSLDHEAEAAHHLSVLTLK